jgi:hypothetical protein
MYKFVDSETGEAIFEDPRLRPHPDWERINPGDTGRDLNCDDPEICDLFQHKETGEIRIRICDGCPKPWSRGTWI